ncbi:MAG: hypothetical protein Q9M43_13635 [Sulfurimonas sp.]|nr:hypothetical protein [Sulfurimonas sp.]
MKIIGKILFFNADSGQGMIMTADKKKINFSVADWDDFETMPSLGLEVRFMYENALASSIVSMSYVEEEPEIKETKEEVKEVLEKEIVQKEIVQKEEASQELKETPPIEEKHEHFESDEDVEEIGTNEELEDELGQREESVTVTMNLPKAVSNYFMVIEENIDKRIFYKKVDGRLNYVVIRRFLWTTFNNLCEIDLHILTPKIKALSDDLKRMASIYDDFLSKIKYPVLAYEEVFFIMSI